MLLNKSQFPQTWWVFWHMDYQNIYSDNRNEELCMQNSTEIKDLCQKNLWFGFSGDKCE